MVFTSNRERTLSRAATNSDNVDGRAVSSKGFALYGVVEHATGTYRSIGRGDVDDVNQLPVVDTPFDLCDEADGRITERDENPLSRNGL